MDVSYNRLRGCGDGDPGILAALLCRQVGAVIVLVGTCRNPCGRFQGGRWCGKTLRGVGKRRGVA